MIKLKIDYDFHINYNSHNNDTVMDYLSFLYGSIIEKNSSNDIYALYKNTKYVFKLDDELNVKEKIFVSDKAWLNIIYCDNEHILFRYEDDDNYYFETLTHKVLSIPISSNYSDYMIKNNELFVYNELKIDTQKARFYSLNLEYLGEIRLDNQMIHIDVLDLRGNFVHIFLAEVCLSFEEVALSSPCNPVVKDVLAPLEQVAVSLGVVVRGVHASVEGQHLHVLPLGVIPL